MLLVFFDIMQLCKLKKLYLIISYYLFSWDRYYMLTTLRWYCARKYKGFKDWLEKNADKYFLILYCCDFLLSQRAKMNSKIKLFNNAKLFKSIIETTIISKRKKDKLKAAFSATINLSNISEDWNNQIDDISK